LICVLDGLSYLARCELFGSAAMRHFRNALPKVVIERVCQSARLKSLAQKGLAQKALLKSPAGRVLL
jgi:hypothetical protein